VSKSQKRAAEKAWAERALKAEEQRKELLAALKFALQEMQPATVGLEKAMARARAAIAKAEGREP
jgi:hypothetical protein